MNERSVASEFDSRLWSDPMPYVVTLDPFDRQFECGEDETLLEAGLRQGVNLRFGCKHGGCGACKIRVADGEIDPMDASSFALMDFAREEGFTLLCSTKALSDVVLDVSEYTEDELFGPVNS
jgi:phenol/toluene 2-monooxygenase (NADH) P5/A5